MADDDLGRFVYQSIEGTLRSSTGMTSFVVHTILNNEIQDRIICNW